VRQESRRQRYDNKLCTSKTYPISLCAINFRVDDNLGYLLRSAACFGAERLYVVGHVPDRKSIISSSGSLYDYVEIQQFTSPNSFLREMDKKDIQIVCGELSEGAAPLPGYSFNFDRHMCLVVGNEQAGIPPEILHKSQVIYIPMPGIGYCLNTSQAANILLYEAVKQYEVSGDRDYLHQAI